MRGRAFFFQAQAGIRSGHVTGVQTCALPIYIVSESGRAIVAHHSVLVVQAFGAIEKTPAESHTILASDRSEERRVGKECSSAWSPHLYNNTATVEAFFGGSVIFAVVGAKAIE